MGLPLDWSWLVLEWLDPVESIELAEDNLTLSSYGFVEGKNHYWVRVKEFENYREIKGRN